MPTRKPRLNITISEEQHALLSELAVLQSVSMASLLNQMLDQATPLLRVTVPMLRAASQELQLTKDRAAKLLKPALAEIHATGLVDQLDIEDALLDGSRGGAHRTERSEGGRADKRSPGA